MAKNILTKKQQIILTFIFIFRFSNSKQIQQLLGHSDHRRINAWLKDLTEKQYIVRDYTPIYGTLTKPAVYSLTTLGRQYITNTFEPWDKTYLKRLRDDKHRSKAFRAKCQLVVDCYLTFFAGKEKELLETFYKTFKEGTVLQENTLQFFTPAFYSELAFDCSFILQLKPDIYVYKKTKDGIDHSYLYIIDAYVPRLTLQYMIKHIFPIIKKQSWEDEDISSLQLYFICPSTMVIIYLERILKSFLKWHTGRVPLSCYFATRNQLYKRKEGKTKKMEWKPLSRE